MFRLKNLTLNFTSIDVKSMYIQEKNTVMQNLNDKATIYSKTVLNDNDLQICFNIREEVFVKEQNVPIDREKDEFENSSTHFLVYQDKTPIGCARICYREKKAHIERVAILKPYRKNGAGKKLMQDIIQYCKIQNYDNIILGAQDHAIDFYKKLGFKICSEKYLDANIWHHKMKY